MNKKQMKKELKRMQTVEQELNSKIASAREDIKVADQKAAEATEKAAEATERAEIAEQKLNDVEKVQEQQGIDLAALAKAINSLEDTKIRFEDEYADWEDKYNQLAKIAEENPRLKEGINLEVMKRGMENAMKSTKFIDEKLNKIYKLAVEIQNFEEYNYQNI